MKSIRDDLKASKSDYAYTVGRTALSSIPFVGGPLVELYNLVLGEPISKRRDEWLASLYEAIESLEEKIDNLNIDTLRDNEQFITIVLKASQIVIRDHALEKKKALINACVNTALNISIDDTEQMMFLNYIDDLTVWHLRVLDYFENPMRKLTEKGINTQGYAGGSPSQPFYDYYPELRVREDFTRIIVKDLYSKGLFSTDNLGGMQTVQGMLASKLTDFGFRFMCYINEGNV